MTDYLQICLKLIDSYKMKVTASLIDQGMAKTKAEEVADALDLEQELIFSLNQTYEKALSLDELCSELHLNSKLSSLFRMKGKLYSHQVEAIKSIDSEICTVISSGTGSGKTESFLIPIVNHCIENENIKGIKAILIYPMNALAGDQLRRIRELISSTNITYAIFSGDTPENSNNETFNLEFEDNELLTRSDIVGTPPDILVTNYVMLERILTNPEYSKLIDSSADTLKHVVLDEIHTYRGNKGIHIRGLIGRLKIKTNNNLVLIGCSATLRNKGHAQEGYLSTDSNTFIESFIKKLFWLKETDTYKYIEPIYKASKDNMNNNIYSDYLTVRDLEIVEAIKDILIEGPTNLREMADILVKKAIILNKEKLVDFFEKIMTVNIKLPDVDPIIDFRVHIFLLKISGFLCRCTGCGKYYTGMIPTCIECGGLTLPVDKFKPDFLIGFLDNGEILNPLINSNVYKSGAPIVFLSFNPENNDDNKDSFRVNRLSQGEKGLKVNADDNGKYQLFLGDNIKSDEMEDHYINFEEESKEGYISYLIKTLMFTLEEKDRKLLTFIDSREKVGRYNVLIGDRLLSHFFYETLKWVNTEHLSIYDLKIKWLDDLKEVLRNNQKLTSEQKQSLLNDAELWFIRFIKLEKMKRQITSCDKELLSSLSLCEIDILQIAIDESCFDYNIRNLFGDIIKVDRPFIEHPRGIGLDSNEGKSISLSDAGIKYKELILKHPLEIREKGLKKLLYLEILKIKQENSIDIESSLTIYFLNETKFKITTDNSSYSNLEEIINDQLLFVDAHSSEISKEKKKVVEAKFQNAEINIVFSTPTLEMGIDIGELSFIMMIGVPPAPSNYAQRVGRAGRRKNRFAAAITICSPLSSHDWYYYHDPKAMINGVISPPKFDENNKKIINKHILALLPIQTIQDAKNNQVNHDHIKTEYIDKLDSQITADDFLENLQSKLEGFSSNEFQINTLYNKGVLPDYGFAKDEIEYFDMDDMKGSPISSRSVDLAFRQVIPGKREFIGDRYYEFMEIENEPFDSYDGKNIMEVNKVFCQNKDRAITRNYEGKGFEAYVVSNPDANPKIFISKGPFLISLLHKTKLHFININKSQNLGYRLERDVIKIELDRKVVDDNQYYSLIAALDRGLKDYCGLDESELTWILNNDIRSVASNANDKWNALLYEKSGTGDIDFISILENLEKWNSSEILKNIFNIIRDCGCNKETGCYLCMRSYTTQRFLSFANKKIAENFVGYLIGERKFNANPRWESRVLKYDNEIVLSKKGNEFLLEDGVDKNVVSIKEKENHDIMKALTLHLIELYENQDTETVKFIVKQDYILNAINETGSLKDSDPWFNKFKFYKCAFKEIVAEKG